MFYFLMDLHIHVVKLPVFKEFEACSAVTVHVFVWILTGKGR